jgi:hypothetical protein
VGVVRIIECRDVQGASIGDGRRQLVAKRSGSTPPSLATHPSVTTIPAEWKYERMCIVAGGRKQDAQYV